MKIPREIAERVVTGSMRELWDVFINLEEEYDEFDEDYLVVKDGEKVKFKLWWLWDSSNRIILKTKESKVYIAGIPCDEDDYEEEKMLRRKVMTQAILSNMEIKSTIEPRGKK